MKRWFLIWSACLVFGLLLAASVARAADRATLFDATFTDEPGQCPRVHRAARRSDGVRGCWTMDEHTRSITVTWGDGRVDRYSEMQFNIYGRVLR